MAAIDRPWSPYRRCISFIHGNERRQGPHHDAQKSTYTTLPRIRPRLTALPAAVGNAHEGACSPTSTAHALVDGSAPQTSTHNRNRMSVIAAPQRQTAGRGSHSTEGSRVELFDQHHDLARIVGAP